MHFQQNIFENITVDHQKQLIISTINDLKNIKYPLKVEYQKAFIKHILNELQKHDFDIEDCIYDAFGRTLNLVQGNYYFKHYEFEGKSIVLKENVNIISQGTTGLSTWQVLFIIINK